MKTLAEILAALVLCDMFGASAEKKKDVFEFSNVIDLNRKFSPIMDNCYARIHGGHDARPSDAPYQAVFRQFFHDGRYLHTFCGGAIITHLHVITAAHCMLQRPPERVTIALGARFTNIWLNGTDEVQRKRHLSEIEKQETWRSPSNSFCHSDYEGDNNFNDIAIVQLNKRLEFSETINAIPIEHNWYPTAGHYCQVSGHGFTEYKTPANGLRIACVPIVNYNDCKKIFPLESPFTQVCAGAENTDSCQGDSGGPMVCSGHLVGLVSFGAVTCGTQPAVYTRVTGYVGNPSNIPFKKCYGNTSTLTCYCRITIVVAAITTTFN